MFGNAYVRFFSKVFHSCNCAGIPRTSHSSVKIYSASCFSVSLNRKCSSMLSVENGTVYDQTLILNPYGVCFPKHMIKLIDYDLLFSDQSLNTTAVAIFGQPWLSGSSVIFNLGLNLAIGTNFSLFNGFLVIIVYIRRYICTHRTLVRCLLSLLGKNF